MRYTHQNIFSYYLKLQQTNLAEIEPTYSTYSQLSRDTHIMSTESSVRPYNLAELSRELATAVKDEETARLIDETKKSAITTAESYDQFRQLVLTATQKPVTSKDMATLISKPDGPGIVRRGWGSQPATAGSVPASGPGTAGTGRRRLGRRRAGDGAAATGGNASVACETAGPPTDAMALEHAWARLIAAHGASASELVAPGAQLLLSVTPKQLQQWYAQVPPALPLAMLWLHTVALALQAGLTPHSDAAAWSTALAQLPALQEQVRVQDMDTRAAWAAACDALPNAPAAAHDA